MRPPQGPKSKAFSKGDPMATGKSAQQTQPRKQRKRTREPPVLDPAETVPMTEEQCRETVQLLVPLVDS